METVVERLGGQLYLGSVDILSSFWQCELAEECQEWFTIVTDTACYAPRRLIQGSRNASSPFAHALVTVLGDLLNTACVNYIDDIGIYAVTEEQFVDNYIAVLARLQEYGLKVAASKVQFYSGALRFCGRVFRSNGFRFDPEYVNAIANMPPPTNAATLASYIATLNWSRSAVPRFAQLVQPLQELLASALKSGPSASKTQRQRILLADCGWNAAHDDAFARLNASVVQNLALCYPRHDYAMTVWFDASDLAWGAVICQCPPEELERPPLLQSHQPLAFLSGVFKGAQQRYSTVEREALALVMVCTKAAHLLRRPGGFTAFTDHRNLIWLFSQDPSVAAARRQAADRIERWGVFLRSFDFQLKYVPGEQNVAADLLSRWTPPSVPASATARAVTRRRAQQLADGAAVPGPGPVVPPADSAPAGAGAPAAAASGVVNPAPVVPHTRAAVFATPSDILDFSVRDCPMVEEVIETQALEHASGMGPPSNTQLDGDGVRVTPDQRIYVPDMRCLRLRLACVAHQASACHRGIETTLSALQQYFYWPGMAEDIAVFVSACLFCAQVRGGGMQPRPLAGTITATAPCQELCFDFVHIRPPALTDGHNYTWLLVLQDSFSRFVELVPCEAADSDVVVRSLLLWFARFGIVRRWRSDGGSHFCSTVVQEFSRLCNADHHIVVAYSSQSNGQIERANREVLTGLRAICAEARLDHGQWPSVLPVVASVINHSPSTVLAGYAPVEVQTGRPPTNPVSVVFLPTRRELQPVPVDSIDFRAHVTALHKLLDDRYARVNAHPARKQPARPGELAVDFDVGCYVLIALRGDKQRRDKLSVRWTGPARVINFVSPLVATVQNLVTGETTDIHCQHLKRYADADLVVSDQLVAFAAHAGGGFVIRELLDHRLSPAPEVLVAWEGYSADGNTWEPIHNILADAPTVMRKYSRSVQDRLRRQELLAYLEAVSKGRK